MIFMGIDPGLALTGYGLIKEVNGKSGLVTYGCIRTSKECSVTERLLKIYNGLTDIISWYEPDTAAVEELFFNKNARSAFLVGEARGVALLAAAHAQLETYEYTPLQVKQSVAGYGRAAKGQVNDMVRAILSLQEVIRPDDAADALAVAICHLHSHKLKERGLI
ncbi:MAG: crossover junction endodeoxyribonuclease RuvC [Firmicutes bacterium HGW-Firmicutes-13]|nr:MAG: crossover junction endodeoxyribonuclease RuvC [Firmicutes bacterium HGW-Firmicutes-13]